MADWTAALLDAAGASNAKLVGHSMGSLIALETAARHPDKVSGLSLIGTAAAMKQRLMAFYFGEGGDLTDREILVRAGGECGLDPDDVRKRLSSDEDVAHIEQAAASAAQRSAR